MRRVLFLDVEGVLHPTRSQPEARFSRVPLLCRWIADIECDLVVSSEWRLDHSLEQLRALLPSELAARVVGVTPTLSQVHRKSFGVLAYEHARQCEILVWLRDHLVTARYSWAALDDSAEGFFADEARLVVVDGAVGLQMQDLERVNELLGTAV